MTTEPSRPAPPAPEAVAQAVALIIKAMEDSEPAVDAVGSGIESNMTHLNRLAWRHEVAAEALQHAAVATQGKATLFRRQRNALLPIHRLPSELLSPILINSVDEDPLHRMAALHSLAQVAWRWWQTIKSDPRFWAHITPPIKSAQMQIRKAGTLPLRLNWPTSRYGIRDLLQRHAERWTSIVVESYPEDVVLQVLCTWAFPRLEYLKFRWTSGLMSRDWTLNLAKFKNLQVAHLPTMPFFYVSPTSNSPLLRTLHLNLYFRALFASRDLKSLESLLRCIPQLIDLKVENLYHDTTWSPPSPPDTPIINLPMLRRLRFCNVVSGVDQEKISLLAQFRAPLLETLGLRYQTNNEDGAPEVDVGGRTIFDALVTRPHALLSQPEDEPLVSVLRNAGPSASLTVAVGKYMVEITAKGSGRGQLDIVCSTKDYVPTYILQPLAAYTLPIDLDMTSSSDDRRLTFWDDALDATPLLLRSLTVDCSTDVAVQVMDRLSTKAPLPNSTNPRAPFLEKLCFSGQVYEKPLWSKSDRIDTIKTMLEKRRNIFTQGGVLDRPKLVVTGPHGLVFDEAEGRWLES